MKNQSISKIIAGIAVILAATGVHANDFNKSWDPYVDGVIMGPAPMLPAEFGGTGVARFKPGNLGGHDLPLGNPTGSNSNDLMYVYVSLACGLPNVSDPSDPELALTALGGPGKEYWDWTYMPGNNTFRGIQNRIIPASFAEEVTIQYKVSINTFKATSPTAYNGINVTINAPAYTIPQNEVNDQASSFAYVEAIDYGDAPISYGVAEHYIDTTKDGTATPGPYYNRFFWLGSHIDADTNYVASVDAMGDDNNATNGLYGVNQGDEDGVTFPVMVAGTTVNIPVSWTIAAGSKPTTADREWAYLSAWIDWNGDGVFDDNGGSSEVVSHAWTYSESTDEYGWVAKQSRRATSVANLIVTVPANAVVDRPIFTRFRVSTTQKLSPIGMAPNGEVEDYQITIRSRPTVHGYLFKDKDGNKIRNMDEDVPIVNALVSLIVGSVPIASTNSNAEGYYFFANVPPGAITLQAVETDATLVGTDGEGAERNRAVLASGSASIAVISYTLGAEGTDEPLNFGYSVHPLSTQLDFRAYTASDGSVMIEISTVNENSNHPIEIYAKIDGVWTLVATVPADQIVGFGSNTYTVKASGLNPGESYEFKIVDESGHIFESGLIEVARSLVAVEAMTLAPKLITLSFKTTPGLAYQVMVCEELGAPWKVEYVRSPTKNGFSDLNNKPFTAGPGATTKVEVPRNDREKAFFKIIQVE